MTSALPSPASPRDLELLDAYLSRGHNLLALAREFDLSFPDLLAWTSQPHVQKAQAHLAAAMAFQQSLADHHRRDFALDTLRRSIECSTDPVEHRRAASTILRIISRPNSPRTRRDSAGATPVPASADPPPTIPCPTSDPANPIPHPTPGIVSPLTESQSHLYPQPRQPDADRDPPAELLAQLSRPDPAHDARQTVEAILRATSADETPFLYAGIAALKNFWDPTLPESKLSKYDFEQFIFKLGHGLGWPHQLIEDAGAQSAPDHELAHFTLRSSPLPFDQNGWIDTLRITLIRRAADDSAPGCWYAHKIIKMANGPAPGPAG